MKILYQYIQINIYKFFSGILKKINISTYSVELGKQLAKAIEPELVSAENVTTHDPSTNGLIAFAKRHRV